MGWWASNVLGKMNEQMKSNQIKCFIITAARILFILAQRYSLDLHKVLQVVDAKKKKLYNWQTSSL